MSTSGDSPSSSQKSTQEPLTQLARAATDMQATVGPSQPPNDQPPVGLEPDVEIILAVKYTGDVNLVKLYKVTDEAARLIAHAFPELVHCAMAHKIPRSYGPANPSHYSYTGRLHAFATPQK